MFVFQIGNDGCRTCVQPYKSVVQGLSRLLVPCHRGFTLVRDAYGFDVRCAICFDKLTAVAAEDLVVALKHVAIDVHWVVLAPTWM